MENKQFAIWSLTITLAFMIGVTIGSVLTAYQVSNQIESMGNIFDKIEIGDINIELNETVIMDKIIEYVNETKEINDTGR